MCVCVRVKRECVCKGERQYVTVVLEVTRFTHSVWREIRLTPSRTAELMLRRTRPRVFKRKGSWEGRVEQKINK